MDYLLLVRPSETVTLHLAVESVFEQLSTAISTKEIEIGLVGADYALPSQLSSARSQHSQSSNGYFLETDVSTRGFLRVKSPGIMAEKGFRAVQYRSHRSEAGGIVRGEAHASRQG